ncbi:MAG TPA: phasin family protein [Thermodesulfovibrionales bacterium]|nr:phasin family protein [Thermodesulfovibrionales bacterium]
MTIFDVVRNALFAGFGVQEKIREFIDELVKKGELSESQGAKLVKEWSEKADKSSEQVSKGLTELIAKAMDRMNLPSKDDIERLEKEIRTLSARVKKLEGPKEG